MIIVLIASIWGTLQWLDDYTHHGQSITVPNVKGLPLKQAEDEIIKLGLNAVTIDSNYVKGMLAGAILEQSPEGNSKVKKGRTIYLTINTSDIPKIAIPDIIDNSSFRQAEARLRAMGFKLDIAEEVDGEKGWVYGIKYKGINLVTGDKVPREAILTLCVGKGDEIKNDSTQTESFIEGNNEPTIDESWF